jgi:hypothetical protein
LVHAEFVGWGDGDLNYEGESGHKKTPLRCRSGVLIVHL